MDKFDDLQDFDLEDILKEFGSEPQPEKAPEEILPEPEPAAQPAVPEVAPAAPTPFERVVTDQEDTNPMEPIFSASDVFEAPEEPQAPLGDTMTFDPSLLPEADAPAHPETDTLRFDLSKEPEAAPEETREAPAQEGPQEETPTPSPIPFPSHRSRLKELKKKLVAGPEKRYYALSEAGLGKLQAAIFVNVLVVLLCAGITALFALDTVPENRLRLVIYSQFLAMLISALMGCQLMLDSIGGLFKGKFTINTLVTITFGVCVADCIFALQELRVPCCAAFCLEMTMALWARYHRHTTEMAQMDTMRKATRLTGIVRTEDFYEGQAGLLRTEGEVEDFMDTYQKPSGPEKLQSFYAFLALVLSIGISVFAGMNHGVSMAVQILATSLLVAVPASFLVSVTRPAAILEHRLHMVGTVLCGWQGIKALNKKAVFPLRDEDLFPSGCCKLNGVKFYGGRNPDEVVSATTSLILRTGSGLVPLFQQLLASRGGDLQTVEDFRNYGGGGIGGVVNGEPVLLGDMNFLQDMGVTIPEGTMVNQAVYAAIDGQLCAVYAISYAKMRSSAAGLVTLSGCRRLKTVMIGTDFMVTEEFIQSKFGIKTKRIYFPEPETRMQLKAIPADPEEPVLAMTTREELISTAYAVTGARAFSTAAKLGVAIHLFGGILGILIMAALAVLGNTALLIPTNILLYQLIWAVPGLLVTEWARTV